MNTQPDPSLALRKQAQKILKRILRMGKYLGKYHGVRGKDLERYQVPSNQYQGKVLFTDNHLGLADRWLLCSVTGSTWVLDYGHPYREEQELPLAQGIAFLKQMEASLLVETQQKATQEVLTKLVERRVRRILRGKKEPVV